MADGIVTLEDLLEEIVGEIYDETDMDLETAETGPAGILILLGTFPIHDLVDLGVELPSGPYTTLAGLVQAHLKRLPPTVGERVRVGSWCLEVAETRRLAITKVRLVPTESNQ